MIREMKVDVAVIGGGLGGCAAALAAARMGKSVVMTEETDWIGGQLTSQAVPPDEHMHIESHGCTQSYRQLRDGVRDYYRAHFPLTKEAQAIPNLNPGGALVSRVAHDPRVAVAVLEQMLAPYTHSGRLTIMLDHVPTAAETDGDEVRTVTVKSLKTGDQTVITAPYIIDATELGDLLPLADVEHVIGAEAQSETGEPHALPVADPLDIQSITHCLALDYIEGEDHTIEKPRDYDFWREYKPDFWPNKLLHWTGVRPTTHEPRPFTLFDTDEDGFSYFLYRRIANKDHFEPGTFQSDVTIMNWQQNDYWLGPIFGVSEEEKTRHLEGAKQLSLSFLYWMQTEAPHPDGKKVGYPGLRIRKDVVGTEDGLAKYPYIRESRRIKAEFTVCEQHITRITPETKRATQFEDTVGIGYYAIDLHPSTSGRHYLHFSPFPFQIPLGSLIPVRVNNLLAGSKNIGTTHITNGCYRLHPVEWNIGESAGALAAFCLEKGVQPREVRNNQQLLEEFQQVLVQQGIELSWP